MLVDGGSRDDTTKLAGQFDVTVMNCSTGRAAQQNLGAKTAAGDVLLFLHADCCLPEDAREQILGALEKTAGTVGGCFRQRIDTDGMLYRWLERGNAWRVRVLKWAYGDQAIFVRRSAFEDLGGFPNLRFMEDLKFMQQLKRKGRIELLPGPLTVSARRWQKRGPVRQTLRNWTLIMAAQLGISPNRLASFYPQDR